MKDKRTYLEIAMMREIIKTQVIYYYDTLFATHIYNTKQEISTKEKNHFEEYIITLTETTIKDFNSLETEFKQNLFEIKILHPRTSIIIVLHETDIQIRNYVEKVKKTNTLNTNLYTHFSNEFTNARKFLRY